jgi:hypothetical protein
MNQTYPGQRQDSHTHVMALIEDVSSRYWFVVRMIIAYLMKEIVIIDLFHTFSPETDIEFTQVKKRLEERGK